jgi:hypothetical protein
MVNDGSFGAPYDYCDVQCERCVFERDCAIARELRNSRWLDDIDVEESVLSFNRRDGDDDGTAAVALGSRQLRERLVGSRRLVDRQSFIERLRRAGVGYSLSLFQLLHELSAPFTEVFKDAEIAAALVAPKVARLTMSLVPGAMPRFDPDFAEDGYRTLLLLEHVDARTALALSAVCSECLGNAAAFEKARAQLWELLAPISAQVPAHARAELARLVVRRRAPSPFFVVSN